MCTAVSLNSGDHYFGRTLDYEYAYDGKITVTPRNFRIAFTDGTVAEKHYAICGMAMVEDGYPLYFDAFNEKGLCVAGLNFPGKAHYEKATSGKINVASFEFVTRVLCQCKNTNEAESFIKAVNITDSPFSEKLKPSPLHWMISDKGRSIVAEQTEQGMKVYENPVGVMTNSPEFDKHMQNLQNYVSVTAEEPKNLFSDSFDFKPYSRGMGSIGLPGDYTSMSRFVRACFVKLNSVCGDTENERVSQLFHILGSVSHPKGCVKIGNGYEITHYTSCCNTDKGIYYYTTYNNSTVHGVDMYREDLDAEFPVTYNLVKKSDFIIQN